MSLELCHVRRGVAGFGFAQPSVTNLETCQLRLGLAPFGFARPLAILAKPTATAGGALFGFARPSCHFVKGNDQSRQQRKGRPIMSCNVIATAPAPCWGLRLEVQVSRGRLAKLSKVAALQSEQNFGFAQPSCHYVKAGAQRVQR